MKPVVSALNAWSWYVASPFLLHPGLYTDVGPGNSVVVSVAAIIILSIIGGLFNVRTTT